jgi:hypothetical protein
MLYMSCNYLIASYISYTLHLIIALLFRIAKLKLIKIRIPEDFLRFYLIPCIVRAP